MSQILLVNNEKNTLNILSRLLKTEGYKVALAEDLASGKELIRTVQFSLMVSSANKELDPELELLKLARTEQPAMPVIVIMEKEKGEMAVKVSKLKPFACIEKPLKVDHLLATIQKAVDYHGAALAENVNLNLQLETHYQFENIVAESPAMKRVCDMVSQVAATDIAVLLAGENGTGKIAIARAIHNNSRRREGQFVTVGCEEGNSAVETELFGETGTESALEKATGGTLFLRRVEDLPLSVQKNLLQALHERMVFRADSEKGTAIDVRVISSMSRNLQQMCEQGSFSSDLYKILRVVLIEISPLRNRREDIIPTFRLILRQKLSPDKPLPLIEPQVANMLVEYPWPGNVSEMEKVLEQVLQATKGNKITMDCLPADFVSRIT